MPRWGAYTLAPVKTRVVVLGAGFGGLELATVLSGALGPVLFRDRRA